MGDMCAPMLLIKCEHWMVAVTLEHVVVNTLLTWCIVCVVAADDTIPQSLSFMQTQAILCHAVLETPASMRVPQLHHMTMTICVVALTACGQRHLYIDLPYQGSRRWTGGGGGGNRVCTPASAGAAI